MSNVTIGFMIESAIKEGNIKLFGGGMQKRTFTHIQYICDIFIDTIYNHKMENTVFNVGEEIYSLNDIAQMISNKIPSKIDNVEWPNEYKLIETGDSILNSEKLKSVSDIKYNYSIEDWIHDQIEYYIK